MNTVRLLFCFVVSITLAGCAAMNENECRTANWYNIGLEDGSQGREMSNLSSYRQACAEYGITANATEYSQGYNEGVVNFCTPQKGYNLGRNGGSYTGICPSPLEKPFVNAYQQGQKIYQQVQLVEQNKTRISALEEEIAALSIAVNETEQRLLAPELTPEARKAELDLLLNQQRQQANAEAELKAAIQQRVASEVELERLRAAAPY
ncbi:DUF2799 domain-containing protein [Salinibius halmophilus]|uniref:DUF2799 domain-containing protein n=1 Tax=Salinibius halmophilus TaxID=1853216 RepID=UPI00131488B4|nr:DUF2799 domain-containing protein [Salinibius halmophilus]